LKEPASCLNVQPDINVSSLVGHKRKRRSAPSDNNTTDVEPDTEVGDVCSSVVGEQQKKKLLIAWKFFLWAGHQQQEQEVCSTPTDSIEPTLPSWNLYDTVLDSDMSDFTTSPHVVRELSGC